MGFQLGAIAVLLVFYGCYLGKMMAQRRQGIQTDQMGKGKAGKTKAIELTMKTATFLVLIVEVISIWRSASSMPPAMRVIGFVLAVCGDVVFIVSVLTMRDSWRAGVSETDKTELVTDGIYQISRNPAFLGFDLVYLGILLMFFNWILCAASIFPAVMFHIQIVNVEEPFLEKEFGKTYEEYKRTVNRYLGREMIKKNKNKHPTFVAS